MAIIDPACPSTENETSPTNRELVTLNSILFAVAWKRKKAIMGSLAKKGLNKYLSQLNQHPLRTKVITSGVLVALSDVTSQKLTGIQKLQLKRILLKVLYGCLYLGPFSHYLHQILDKIFHGKRDTKTVAKKVALEQLTASPWNHFVFLVYYGLIIEGRTWVQVKAKVKKEFPSLQLTAWMGIIFERPSKIRDVEEILVEN
ncbi:peroxisomal membrane protein PMP22 [Cucumis melo var. makuwa]|uniref:Peroxisomal membrane protein PMP22 n=1 Tax=Cucumis melo var. makuwa TaxID=1194695 RepID=A0A5D3CNV5_CUCMM|nr:peroxisomal membrane protein PMP22 [Cucumis melo var. makuwa]